jgi:hypothetical protein
MRAAVLLLLLLPWRRQQRQLKVDEDHARNTMERVMPRDVSRGLNSVRRFVQTHGIQ